MLLDERSTYNDLGFRFTTRSASILMLEDVPSAKSSVSLGTDLGYVVGKETERVRAAFISLHADDFNLMLNERLGTFCKQSTSACCDGHVDNQHSNA